MRRDEHLGVTFILAIPIAAIFYLFGIIDYIYLIIPMFFTTMLPDILEPANHYTHRKFFHSKRVLMFLSKFCIIPFLILGFFSHFFFYILFGVLGYISHLLADSTTKMGLPE
jgi:membrane-bound metal-dependent hydrolase YbcI (DUF457 family)